jgi:hypothetical protein
MTVTEADLVTASGVAVALFGSLVVAPHAPSLIAHQSASWVRTALRRLCALLLRRTPQRDALVHPAVAMASTSIPTPGVVTGWDCRAPPEEQIRWLWQEIDGLYAWMGQA